MIPVIYAGNETSFSSLGIGSVPEALSCVVDEVRNQSNTLTLVAPIDATQRDALSEGNIILADTNERLRRQPYEIVKTEESLADGRIIVSAQHVAYRLRYSVVRQISGTTVSGIFTAFKTAASMIEENGFTFSTDIATSHAVSYSYMPVWDILHGTEGSLIDTFGGVIEMDKFTIKLNSRRGQDNGVVVPYGKNLVDLERDIDSGDIINGIFPVYSSGGEITVTGTAVQYSANASRYSYKRTEVVDFSDRFGETVPTPAQLNTAAAAMVNGQGLPQATLTGSFIPLKSTLDYQDFGALESVAMDDLIRFYVPRMNVDISTRVVATHWDVLRERYESVEVGDVRQTIRQAIAAI